MATATIPAPDVMQFELDTEKIFKEVRHYYLIEGKKTLSNKINIGINRGFSKAKYTYSLKIRHINKWSKQITGLFPTHDPDLFYGDTKNKTNLLLMRFINNGETLKVYYFKGYYKKPIADFIKVFKD